MKVFDDVLQKEIYVQEEITPEIGKELILEDPAEFDELQEVEQ